jgi:phospho-N-acetylmuramoyl-pentapeptide-transferase
MNLPNILPLSLGFVIFSFLVNAVLIVPFIDLLYKLKFTRRIEGGKTSKSLFDKLHDKKAGTPIGGGILLVVSVTILFGILFPLISYLGVYISTAYKLGSELFVIFFTFVSFGALGLLDDYKKIFGQGRAGNLGSVFGLSRKQKFTVQFILAFVISFWLYQFLGIHFIHVPFLKHVIDLGILYIPLSMLVIVFFTNAFNITDGLDGLSGGLLVIYLFAFIVIAAANVDTPLSIFIALWIGALMAFLYFNVYPARIWLGDTGALSFGAMIAVIGLMTGNVAPLFIIGGIFVVEGLSSFVQILGWRFLNRRILPLSPVHHALEAIGWEEPKIVTRAWLAGIMLAILGLWLAKI